MSIRISSFVLFLALAVACGNSHAQDLESYKKKYQDALDKISSDHAEQVQRIKAAYATGLVSAKDQVQAAGDLNKVKATLSEISRFEKDQTLPQPSDAVIPEIDALRANCQKGLDNAAVSRAQAIVNLATGYDRALVALQRDLTRKGDLEKATAVQEERKILAGTELLTSAQAFIAAESKRQPVVSTPQVAQQPPVSRPQLNDPDKGWTKLFRGSGPSIWNTDTDVGEDSYAITLDKAPKGIQFLRIKLVDTNEVVIIPMNNDSLAKDINLGGYGWYGAKSQHNGHIYLGIANRAWGATYRDGNHCSIGGSRGWGWGTSPPGLTYPGAAFSWKGDKQETKVIEISVKTDKLTIPEKNKMLK